MVLFSLGVKPYTHICVSLFEATAYKPHTVISVLKSKHSLT